GAPAHEIYRDASAAAIRIHRTWNRVMRGAGAFLSAAGQPCLHRRRGAWTSGCAAARLHRGRLPAAADDPDGRVAAGYRALDQIDPARRLLVGTAVRREHGGRGLRLSPPRLLPATSV